MKAQFASIIATAVALSYSLSAFVAAFNFNAAPVVRRCTPTQLLMHSESESESTQLTSRRSFLSTMATLPIITTALQPAYADEKSLMNDLTTSLDKISTIPALLKEAEWDKVRTVLKTPPVNSLWNLGESSNPLQKLALATDNIELLELKDELSISLQMTDQYSYDNVFIYYQPGNGKVKTKEPMEMAEKAIRELREAVDILTK